MDRHDYDEWWHVDAIFAEASELSGKARSNFLDETCGENDALRRRVDRLLRAHEASGDYLEHSAGWLDMPTLPGQDNVAGLSKMDDARIGPYRLLREIGRGGMGTVYLAERADGQFSQRVALKLIRGGFVTEQAVRRFRLEREILARLEHPNIARLIDGNITEDGWPYLVMEFVAGTPITAYCDEKHLSVSARLELFMVVCETVHYAHQNLVIHRDLTPNNILVSADGEVKLLDFGIAKLLDDETASVTVPVTEEGLRLMTPEYASPEQARGESITTASDVYQLGILLYELLTGHRPFELPSRVLHEFARIVCEEEPERPSVRVTRENADGARNLPVERLRRRLSGDLDNVVLMAIRKEPARRYASAEQLSDDVDRHLRGFPVRARRDTVGYRMSKFVRRHRIGVAAAAIAIVSLAGGLGTALWQAGVAAEERDQAQIESEKARQVADFLVGVFDEANPESARGDTLTAHEILDLGARRINAELVGQPEIRASMLDVMGRAYQNLGDYDRARAFLTEALEIRRENGAAVRDVLRSLIHLIELLHETEDWSTIDSLTKAGFDLDATPASPSAERADLYGLAGRRSLEVGDLSSADSLLRIALEIRKRVYGPSHPEVATSYNDLGIAVHTAGNLDLAREYYLQSLSIRRETEGSTHPEYAMTMSNLGWLQMRVGNYDAADSTLTEVLRIRRALYGDEHPYVARSHAALTEVMLAQHRYPEARNQIETAISIFLRSYHEDHTRVVNARNTLAAVAESSGDPEEAIRIRARILERGLDDAGIMRGRVLNDLAATYQRTGDLETAEELFIEALSIYESLYGKDHPSTEIVRRNLASVRESTDA